LYLLETFEQFFFRNAKFLMDRSVKMYASNFIRQAASFYVVAGIVLIEHAMKRMPLSSLKRTVDERYRLAMLSCSVILLFTNLQRANRAVIAPSKGLADFIHDALVSSRARYIATCRGKGDAGGRRLLVISARARRNVQPPAAEFADRDGMPPSFLQMSFRNAR